MEPALAPEGQSTNECAQQLDFPLSQMMASDQGEGAQAVQAMPVPKVTLEVVPWDGSPFKICCHPQINGETLRTTAARHIGRCPDHICLFNSNMSLEIARAPYVMHQDIQIAVMDNCTLAEQGLRDGSVIRVSLVGDGDESKLGRYMDMQDQRQFLTYGPPAGPPSTSMALTLVSPMKVVAPARTPGRKNCKWSHKETWALLFGMERYGPGRWKKILVDQEFGQHLQARTYVHLKDKWGNLYRTFRTGRVPRGDTALFLPKVREIYMKWSESF